MKVYKLMPRLARAHGCPRHLSRDFSIGPIMSFAVYRLLLFVMSAKIQRDPTSFRPFFCLGKCNLQPFLSRFYTILFICGPRSFLSQTVACVRFVVTEVQGSLRWPIFIGFFLNFRWLCFLQHLQYIYKEHTAYIHYIFVTCRMSLMAGCLTNLSVHLPFTWCVVVLYFFFLLRLPPLRVDDDLIIIGMNDSERMHRHHIGII